MSAVSFLGTFISVRGEFKDLFEEGRLRTCGVRQEPSYSSAEMILGHFIPYILFPYNSYSHISFPCPPLIWISVNKWDTEWRAVRGMNGRERNVLSK